MDQTFIFVFGSNLAGRHGAGSALEALQNHGAVLGKGVGLHGRSYAIPTKDENLKTMELPTIARYVTEFLHFAREKPTYKFSVVEIGCGLAGYTPEQIAPMFKGYPPNVTLSFRFKQIIDALG